MVIRPEPLRHFARCFDVRLHFQRCRDSPRRASDFLVARQESHQRIVPHFIDLASPDFPPAGLAVRPAMQTRLRLKQHRRTSPPAKAITRRFRRGSGSGALAELGMLRRGESLFAANPLHAMLRRVASFSILPRLAPADTLDRLGGAIHRRKSNAIALLTLPSGLPSTLFSSFH